MQPPETKQKIHILIISGKYDVHAGEELYLPRYLGMQVTERCLLVSASSESYVEQLIAQYM